MNADSVEMWSEYVKMELGFVESMRRRWGVLGIEVKGKEKVVDSPLPSPSRIQFPKLLPEHTYSPPINTEEEMLLKKL